MKNNAKLNQWLQTGLSHHQHNDLAKAKGAYEKVIKAKPDHADALHLLGVLELQLGHADKAIQTIQKAIASNPEVSLYYGNLAEAFVAEKRYLDAMPMYRKALVLDPNNIDAQNNLGVTYGELHRYEEAVSCYDKALVLKPDFADAYNNKGNALRKLRRHEEAIANFEQALRLNPSDSKIYGNLADEYESQGDFKSAAQYATAALKLDRTAATPQVMLAQIEVQEKKYEAAHSRLQSLLSQPLKLTTENKIMALLAFTEDKLNLTDAAFAHATQMNQLAKRQFDALGPMRPGPTSKEFLVQLQGWIEKNQDAKITSYNCVPDYTPVFLVGFPRSGTTLLDQILSSHPNVTVLEELPLFEEVFREYVSRPDSWSDLTLECAEPLVRLYQTRCEQEAKREGRQGEGLIIDKLPLNLVHLPLINQVMPNAKIIVALRDPRDAVLSCYMQNFSLNHAMYHFLTLPSAVEYYTDIMGLLTQYQKILPLSLQCVQYESVISDLEKNGRMLTEFLGLPWDERMLAYRQTAKSRQIHTPSYRQVTQPLYQTSNQRWRRYQDYLQPHLAALSPWVQEFGYE